MTVTILERQRIIQEYEAEQAEKRRRRMSDLGKIMTPKKKKALKKSIKRARAAKKKKCKPNQEMWIV